MQDGLFEKDHRWLKEQLSQMHLRALEAFLIQLDNPYLLDAKIFKKIKSVLLQPLHVASIAFNNNYTPTTLDD